MRERSRRCGFRRSRCRRPRLFRRSHSDCCRPGCRHGCRGPGYPSRRCRCNCPRPLCSGRKRSGLHSCRRSDSGRQRYQLEREVEQLQSKEEKAKIESELGFKCEGTWFSNRIQCTCGGVYGMFEFIQQGLREHDRDWIKAVLELKNTSVIRVNPALDAFCPQCHQAFIHGHWYQMKMPNGTLSYGCCKGGVIV